MSSIPWENSGINGARGSSYPVGIKRKQMAKEAGVIFFSERKNVGGYLFLLLLLFKGFKEVNVLNIYIAPSQNQGAAYM